MKGRRLLGEAEKDGDVGEAQGFPLGRRLAGEKGSRKEAPAPNVLLSRPVIAI
jgi:hypothetical protein